jgi:probable HAF family extracellular repeat protein
MRHHLKPLLFLPLIVLSGAVLLASCDTVSPETVLPEDLMSSSTAAGYAAMDLGTLGGNHSLAYGVNEAGQVVGMSQTADGQWQAFVWQDGQMTGLGTLGGTQSSAYAVNNSGHVVGESTDGGQRWRAFVWQGADLLDLGPTSEAAFAINAAGLVVGGSDGRAFIWDGEVSLIVDYASEAHGINDAGLVVGWGAPDGTDWRPIIWEMTSWEIGQSPTLRGAILLPALSGSVAKPLAVNNSGVVVGWSPPGGSELPPRVLDLRRAVRWHAEQIQDLGTLGGAGSEAHGINDLGQIVGVAQTSDGLARPFLWHEGVMQDLGTLSHREHAPELQWPHHVARHINSSGVVVGYSVNAEGYRRATLWVQLTPQQVLQNLAADVEALADDGTLTSGEAQSLTKLLNLAAAMIDDGNTTTAGAQLQAFISRVERLVQRGVLTAEEGQALIDPAQDVVAGL